MILYAIKQLYGYWIFRKRVYVHGFFYVGDRKRISIGERCSINSGVYITTQNRVRIGSDVTLSARCMLLDSGLKFGADVPSQLHEHVNCSITIEDGVWIGAAAIILPNVVVGTRSVVGAGSVVTRSVPPGCVVAGNPARVVRKYE